MLKVYRSETEQYVVVHEPSQSVVLADTFEEAHARLRERLGDRFDEEVATPPTAASGRSRGPTAAIGYGLLAVLALLPFVWLGVLHVSLGALVVELRRSLDGEGGGLEATEGGTSLQAELDTLERQVDSLSGDLAKLRKTAAPRARTAPTRAQDAQQDDGPDEEDEDEDDEDEHEPAGRAPPPATPPTP